MMTADAQGPIHALVTAIAPVDQHDIVDLRDQYVIADVVAHITYNLVVGLLYVVADESFVDNRLRTL